MKTIKKQHLFLTSIIVCVLAFVFPFLIKSYEDSLYSVLSLALTAVGTVGTVATLVIAILLFDRFGLEGKLIVKQTEKVLELADLLKGKTITVKSKESIYFVRPSRRQLAHFVSFPSYQLDHKKIILMSPDDYELALRNIIAVRRSYLLPQIIKDKMTFLQFAAFCKLENIKVEQYVRFDFNETNNKNWMLTSPEITFEQFNKNLQDLVLEIENWLKKHSDFPLDLKLEEPNQYIPNQPMKKIYDN